MWKDKAGAILYFFSQQIELNTHHIEQVCLNVVAPADMCFNKKAEIPPNIGRLCSV